MVWLWEKEEEEGRRRSREKKKGWDTFAWGLLEVDRIQICLLAGR